LDALDESVAATTGRHARKRARLLKDGESATDEGGAVLEYLLPTLSEYMQSPARPRPPQGLDDVIGRLKPDELALAALAPLMNFIAADKSKPKKKPYNVRLAMGEALHRACFMARLLESDRKLHRRLTKMPAKKAIEKSGYRREEWSKKQHFVAGHWLLRCCLRGLPDVFELRSRVPFIREWFAEFAPELCVDLARRYPVFHPSIEPLHPWTGWRTGGYWNKSTPISATFVRDYNPDTKEAVESAFRDGSMSEHVDGVNALQSVGWTINQPMLRVVRQFAGEKRSDIRPRGKMRKVVRDRKRDEFLRRIGKAGLKPSGGGVGKRVGAALVEQDLAIAEQLVGQTFYLPHNCDFRGRVYPIPHFNYAREDHVRSLFLFANRMPINASDARGGLTGTDLLAMHAAACADFQDADGRRISKRPFRERVAWANSNRELIKRIARDPINTVDEWRDADAPFSFVAACMELAEAWKNPAFETRLPVFFDATCSGVQHLAMMMVDEDAGARVNLVDGFDEPQDVYSEIRARVIENVRNDPDVGRAKFWLDDLCDERAGRQLIKRPGMTFCYSATVHGMAKQVCDAWDSLPGKDNQRLEWSDAWYLATHVARPRGKS
jgi:DNA-directed RNA polymerase